MEYVQERITTLHDFDGTAPRGPIERTTVIVPMTSQDVGSDAATQILTILNQTGPGGVIIPARVNNGDIGRFNRWADQYAPDATVIWCNSPRIDGLLDDNEISSPMGKGRDVWLALGVSTIRTDQEFVIVHDADARSYSADLIHRLCWPLEHGFTFSKGYYARIEDNRLYGRLFRLFIVPLLRALRSQHDHEVIHYLESFRYALAGEIGMTRSIAGRVRSEPTWGFEMGMLGEMFHLAGEDRVAQVDLGIHEHDHRAVGGPGGLAMMSRVVSDAVMRLLADHEIQPDIPSLRTAYRCEASSICLQYGADAAFNGLDYDLDAELAQIDSYSKAIDRPDADARLPAWEDVKLDPSEIQTVSEEEIRTA